VLIKNDFPLRDFTTIGIGGPARLFVTVTNEKELVSALKLAKKSGKAWYVLGEGSNMVASDRGFSGMIIANQIEKYVRKGDRVTIGAGNNLFKFIMQLNVFGLAGMERMAGIPGTVGGAIYGCAGAYGQEIRDHLVSVRFWDGKKFRKFSNEECGFGYRGSAFKKHKNWVLTEAVFKLETGRAAELMKISRDTISLREKKYYPGLKCPGSFFKNLKLDDLPAKGAKALLKKIDPEAVKYGKLPSGYLLERIGAKGMKQGRVAVAHHHANLIFNTGGGKAADVKKLSTRLKRLVKKKFGIIIDEEVQYL